MTITDHDVITPATGTYIRSIDMHSLNEALARDRQREAHRHSRHARLVRQVSSERRWHRPARAGR